MAAENLGLDFSSMPTKVMGGEVIEILNDEEEEAINEFVREEILMKLEEPDQEEEVLQDAVKTVKGDEPRRLARAQIANRQYKDYELYVTVEEEEIILATVGDKHDEEDNDEEELAVVAHYVMTHYAEREVIKKKKYKPKSGQYQLKAGIKQFGKQGESAVTKELNQFNKYKVFEPQHANDLSEEDKRKALLSLIFLKEKKDGNIKARLCANGNPQREHIAKEEAAAPTVTLESVFITSTTDAKEGRKVVTIDVPGAFLHVDNDDYVIMKMVGMLTKLMAKTNPRLYIQYVVLEKGRSVLYL